jgi:hypothetical protein
LRFPYHKFLLAQPNPVSGRSFIERPIIPILVGRPRGQAHKYAAILDSGSDWCVFHAGLGEALGLRFEQGRAQRIVGIESSSGIAFFQDVEVVAGSMRSTFCAGFLRGIPASYGVLGQFGFFDRLRITFEGSPERSFVEILPAEEEGDLQ